MFCISVRKKNQGMKRGAQWLSGRVLYLSLTGVTALCPDSLSKNINPSLVLVQPRKTRPFITERLLMGRKESKQTKQHEDSHELPRILTVWSYKCFIYNIIHI